MLIYANYANWKNAQGCQGGKQDELFYYIHVEHESIKTTLYTYEFFQVHIISTGTGNFNANCDIGGQTIAGGTIPPHILITNKRPDLVIVWEDPKQILLIELTVPFESNITDAHKRKIDRYKALVQDLNETDYDTIYEAIEVGQRGFIDKENKTRIKQILAKCGCNKRPKELVSDSWVLLSFSTADMDRHGLMHHTCQFKVNV